MFLLKGGGQIEVKKPFEKIYRVFKKKKTS